MCDWTHWPDSQPAAVQALLSVSVHGVLSGAGGCVHWPVCRVARRIEGALVAVRACRACSGGSGRPGPPRSPPWCRRCCRCRCTACCRARADACTGPSAGCMPGRSCTRCRPAYTAWSGGSGRTGPLRTRRWCRVAVAIGAWRAVGFGGCGHGPSSGRRPGRWCSGSVGLTVSRHVGLIATAHGLAAGRRADVAIRVGARRAVGLRRCGHRPRAPGRAPDRWCTRCYRAWQTCALVGLDALAHLTAGRRAGVAVRVGARRAVRQVRSTPHAGGSGCRPDVGCTGSRVPGRAGAGCRCFCEPPDARTPLSALAVGQFL